MKFLMAFVAMIFAQNALAIPLDIQSCREAEVSANTITEMRVFSNGQIKLFAHDQGEPAASPVGIQITYDRGQEPDIQSFCVYVRGLSDVSLKTAQARYVEETNTLYVYVPGRRYIADNDDFAPTTVSLTIHKEGRRTADIFSASAR
jgi:hypothetical protein